MSIPRIASFAALTAVALVAVVGACDGSGTEVPASKDASPEAAATDSGGCGVCVRPVRCVAACGAAPVQVGCCACPTGTFDDVSCVADGGADAPLDAPPDARALCPLDAAAPPALAETLIEGPWLFGVPGSPNRFSWARFNFTAADPRGSLSVLDPAAPYTPYFPCQGTGLTTADPAQGTAILQLPDGCSNEARTFTFLCFHAPAQNPKATLEAEIVDDKTGQRIVGFRYPKAHCDAGFTSCAAP